MAEELKIDNDKATKEMLEKEEYKYGFIMEVEQDVLPTGLNEDVIKFISKKKNEPEWLLDYRLKGYKKWLTMKDPAWGKLNITPIDFNNISYFAGPKKKPESLDDLDPEILETYEKLGIPLEEQKMLSGVAVDAVFDSVSVATTYKGELDKLGIIFCSISEAIKNHQELIKKYLSPIHICRCRRRLSCRSQWTPHH